ncbi:putative ATP-binding protein [Candidatus Termititenax aidoneus]|uniref:ATP-binding protein n=1 Tax=Termititenax aidoneus TaxID=2218524 RepID=A0A388T931_TERA1|nr:putative ATP-binding protein [Candidatus Termititenax aidoneus]
MGIPVLIFGKSGSGKTTSLRNFKDYGLISCIPKPLPFKGEAVKRYVIDDAAVICQMLLASKTNKIVIDDAGYIMTNFYLRNKNEGNKFGVFDDVAKNFKEIVDTASSLPDDKIVYIIMHSETTDSGETRPLTIGKMLNDKINLAGMFTICLISEYADGKYMFKTQTRGLDCAKSPIGMFDFSIDNDLAIIDAKIREYYGLKDKPEANKAETKTETKNESEAK